MSTTIVNMARARNKRSIQEEQVVKRQGLVPGVKKKDGRGGLKRKPKLIVSVMERDHQGKPITKKRKGKLQDNRAKEHASPSRATRSASMRVAKDGQGLTTSHTEGKIKQRVLVDGGAGKRKRGRELVIVTPNKLKKSKGSARKKFSPLLAKINEEQSGPDGDTVPLRVSRPTIEIGTAELPVLGKRKVTGPQKIKTKEKGVEWSESGTPELQKIMGEEKIVTRAEAKKLATVIVNARRVTKKPVLKVASGLKELRKSTRQLTRQEKAKSPKQLLETKRNSDTADAQSRDSSEDSSRTTRSKSTTNALRVAEDASGFVRMALNSVAGRCEQAKEQSRKSNENGRDAGSKDDTRSSGSARCRTSSMTAEKLVEELGAIRPASKDSSREVPKGGNAKEKMRKTNGNIGQTRGITQELKEATLLSPETKRSRSRKGVTVQRTNEKSVARKVKTDIEDHVKKYGLLEKPLGRSRKQCETPVSGVGSVVSVADGDKSLENAPALALSTDNGLWTKEQETALQDAYASIKPAADFWFHISKRVPGRSAEECFNKFYSGHPTPPAAQRPNRRIAGSPETWDDSFLLLNGPKGKTAGGKQRLLEAHRTIRNILRKQQVDDEDYEADAFVALERPDVVESVLDRAELDEAVIFKATEIPSCTPTRTEKKKSTEFDTIIISGLSSGVRTPSDKENRRPHATGASRAQSQLCSPEVLKKVKDPTQLDKYIDHLHYRQTRRPKTTGSQRNPKKNNVYLHSKDALDFGDNTLFAIQRAKEELRNVFLKSGSGGTFFDVVGHASVGVEDELEDDREGATSSDYEV